VNLSANVRLELRFRAARALPEGPIKYAIGQCAHGKVLVACSVAGICAILLDEDAEALRGQLRAAFPSEHVEEAFTDLEASLAAVAAFIDGTGCESVLRLDITGSAFQQRVWNALCSIPAGQVRTYAEVARNIGAARRERCGRLPPRAPRTSWRSQSRATAWCAATDSPQGTAGGCSASWRSWRRSIRDARRR
jgi:O6-methylguanine-DNA--protein-cysteine methyltransferase